MVLCYYRYCPGSLQSACSTDVQSMPEYFVLMGGLMWIRRGVVCGVCICETWKLFVALSFLREFENVSS